MDLIEKYLGEMTKQEKRWYTAKRVRVERLGKKSEYGSQPHTYVLVDRKTQKALMINFKSEKEAREAAKKKKWKASNMLHVN